MKFKEITLLRVFGRKTHAGDYKGIPQAQELGQHVR